MIYETAHHQDNNVTYELMSDNCPLNNGRFMLSSTLKIVL